MNLRWGMLHAGLQSVLDTALDAVIVMDVNGLVIGWNDRAAECFGWSWEEAGGQRLRDPIIPTRLREYHEAWITHSLATGEGPVLNQHIEITGLRRCGEEFPVELSVTASNQFGDELFVG